MSSNDQSGKSLALLKPFKEIAEAGIARGLTVIVLKPKEKRPFLPNWQTLATRDLVQIIDWADKYPDANCGAYCSYETTWILDIDDFNWFFENWPFKELPKTFTVRTGSGGLQFHFKHSEGSKTLRNTSLKNPAYVEGKDQLGVKAAFLDVLVNDRQGVLPGSTHPNGRTYETLQDLPLAEIAKEHLEWLKSCWDELGKKTATNRTRLNPLRPGIDIEEKLREFGLKFTTHKEGQKTYFNYHSLMGKCLVRGASHASPGERSNERQSAFVYDTKTNEVYHYCFSAGCTETPGKTKIALAALGLKLEDLVVEWWDASFRGLGEMSDEPLEMLIEGFIPEETSVAFGGLAGHGKTWIALSIAKALINAPGKLWDLFEIKKKRPVLYLTPEVGDKSLKKRAKLLNMNMFSKADFMARTFSSGEALLLDSKEVLAAAKGRVVFLDTTICFVRGVENDAGDNATGLRRVVIGLLAAGAIAVILLHHAPKGFEKEDYMTLENVLRGSGDIGAMVGAAYGVKFIDNVLKDNAPLQIENVKPRDFEGPKPFQLQLRPYIDKTGDIGVIKKPGEANPLRDEQVTDKKKVMKTRDQLIVEAHNKGLNPTQISNLEGVGVDRSVVSKRIKTLKEQDPTLFNTEEMDEGEREAKTMFLKEDVPETPLQ
jgi:hypothetical protein